jgi:hypothetical protein
VGALVGRDDEDEEAVIDLDIADGADDFLPALLSGDEYFSGAYGDFLFSGCNLPEWLRDIDEADDPFCLIPPPLAALFLFPAFLLPPPPLTAPQPPSMSDSLRLLSSSSLVVLDRLLLIWWCLFLSLTPLPIFFSSETCLFGIFTPVEATPAATAEPGRLGREEDEFLLEVALAFGTPDLGDETFLDAFDLGVDICCCCCCCSCCCLLCAVEAEEELLRFCFRVWLGWSVSELV